MGNFQQGLEDAKSCTRFRPDWHKVCSTLSVDLGRLPFFRTGGLDRSIRNFKASILPNWGSCSCANCSTFRSRVSLARGPFLESPVTFREHFGWHNSPCIFKTKASRGTKLYSYFNFNSLYNIWKDQLYRISGLEFYEKLSGLSRIRTQLLVGQHCWVACAVGQSGWSFLANG